MPIGSKDRRVVYHTPDPIEAPNWSRDGQFLLFNSGGHIYRLPVKGGTPIEIDTGSAHRCNNDHGLSPDGTRLAISDQSRGGKSLIYLAAGFRRRLRKQITPSGPSYWHGWSPGWLDAGLLRRTQRRIRCLYHPSRGGRRTAADHRQRAWTTDRNTRPDGKFIYFNSERTGTMQIWRMKPDGSEQEQVTSDDFNNWFAHPSPDGKWLVFLYL